MIDTGIYATQILRESPKAILVAAPASRTHRAREVWLPRKAIEFRTIQRCFGPQIFVQPWLARDRGF
jgi:hypothetical protein